MNRQDLKDPLLFAQSQSLMSKPVTEVVTLWDKWLKEYFEDCEADYWIGQNDLC